MLEAALVPEFSFHRSDYLESVINEATCTCDILIPDLSDSRIQRPQSREMVFRYSNQFADIYRVQNTRRRFHSTWNIVHMGDILSEQISFFSTNCNERPKQSVRIIYFDSRFATNL